MAVKVRGGEMGTETNNVTAFDVDMRDLLRAKKTGPTAISKETAPDYSSLVSGISASSVHEIDYLIEGLQGLREKLNNDGDHLRRQIVQHAAFSQSIVDLTKIVSDGMASVSKSGGV
jgi:hypothetical protein